MTALRLAETLETHIDERIKGIPGGTSAFPLRALGEFGWNVVDQDLPLPLLVLKDSHLQHNLSTMSRYCGEHGVEHAPHGKTTMAPQLFQAQLGAGCWGLTAATVEQLQVYRAVGVPRVLFANQLVGAPHLNYVARELHDDPSFELVSWVDSPAGVEGLGAIAGEIGLLRPLDVCLEVGFTGGRTGIRDDQQLESVIRAIRKSSGGVRLVGVSAFEGGLPRPKVGEFLSRVVEVAERLDGHNLLAEDWMLTAGGSSYFDAVVDVFHDAAPRVVLRSGCYITHDHGAYAATSPLADEFKSALELWAYVQSTPEPGLAIVGFGRRDVPDDYGLPVPLARWPVGAATPEPLSGHVATLNDQHCFLRHEGSLAVGDRATFGLSHPCRAFDKWRVVYVVDDAYDVIDGVLTYF